MKDKILNALIWGGIALSALALLASVWLNATGTEELPQWLDVANAIGFTAIVIGAAGIWIPKLRKNADAG